MKIFKSALMVLAMAALVAGATTAYFSDTATVAGNTFSAGILEIRTNGQNTMEGQVFGPAAPGDVHTSDEYHISNYGAPHFGGPSNLPAEKVMVSAKNPVGPLLWLDVRTKVEVTRVWPVTDPSQWQTAYEGKIRYLNNVDLLGPIGLSQLNPGNSFVVRYHVWYPDTGQAQNNIMGETLDWDLVFEGRTS